MGSYIYIFVEKAENLIAGDITGNSDAFCNVCLSTAWHRIKATKVVSSLNPVWNHAMSFPRPNTGEEVTAVFQVFDKDWLGQEFLGSARLKLDEIPVGSLRDVSLALQPHHGNMKPNKQGNFGQLHVKLSAGDSREPPDFGVLGAGAPAKAYSQVDAGRFLSPVARMGVSGGTAPFFRLALVAPHDGGRAADAYIGKDLSRAEDEAEFYECARGLRAAPDGPERLGPLLRFMFEYEGVLTAHEAGPGGAAEEDAVQLLVLQNLHCGMASLRLLDIKMGQHTAHAGWKGKSWKGAAKQSFVDSLTNSATEGFRVEGFDGPPASFTSMDPLLDLRTPWLSLQPLEKKARRVMLQRLQGREVLGHFLRVEAGAAEVAEVVLHELAARLASLAAACRQVAVPQKWVGSSVALGFDAGRGGWSADGAAPSEAELRRSVLVHIFDWGRSELCTAQQLAALTQPQRDDRAEFWQYYKGGVDKLAYDVASLYHHWFGTTGEWAEVVVRIYDFDSATADDFLGSARLPMQSQENQTVELTGQGGKHCGTLTYSMSYHEARSGSRLKAVWSVKIIKAAGLAVSDIGLTTSVSSDPFATITAVSSDGARQFEQRTAVVENNLNPEWEESFDVPIAATDGMLEQALSCAGVSVGGEALAGMLLLEDVSNEEFKSSPAYQEWLACLDQAASA